MRKTKKQRIDDKIKLIRPRWFSRHCYTCEDDITGELLYQVKLKGYSMHYCTRCCSTKKAVLVQFNRDFIH